jgi:hypothetical protein
MAKYAAEQGDIFCRSAILAAEKAKKLQII